MDSASPVLASADNSHIVRDLMFNKPLVEMPQTAQQVATLVFAVLALLTLVYAVRVAKRTGHSYPLWVFAASLVALPFETFDLTLGHCLYPQVGQWTAIELLGVKLPWFLVFIYPVYIAGMVIFIYEHMLNGTLTRSLWWKVALGSILGAAAFEPPGLYFGLWLYFGDNEPFRIFGLPFWWAFANPVAILSISLFSYHVWSSLLNKRYAPVLLVVMPMLLFAVHTAVATPVYFALNSTQDTVITNAAALATAALALFVVWIGSHLVSDSRRTA